ncbi:MAG: SRPBCC family protein [Nitrosopumilus sp. H8]|nr:MAG: SRPBCC family protein [Nitrosopumilus sp. H13]RNJ78931.1 MAG: SRPBCC family protein [Nitrosopumilus sp. H8]
MPRFTVSHAINAKREDVFAAFSDYARYPELAPDYFESVRTRSSRDSVSVTEERIRIGGRSMLITAKHVVRDWLHGIYFVGGDAKGSSIEMSFSERGGMTQIEMSVNLKIMMLRSGAARRDCLRALQLLSGQSSFSL